MDAIVVCRVSDPKQEEHGLSLDEQQRAGRQYANDHGLRLVQEFVFQEQSSRPADRKRFKAIYDFIESYKGETALAVLVYRYNRLARNDLDFARFKQFVRAGRTELHFTMESRPPLRRDSTPGEYLVTAVEAAVAEHKAMEMSVDGKRYIRIQAEMGWPPFRAPVGYKNVRASMSDPQSRKKDMAIVVPDERTAPMVRRAFELWADGWALTAILTKLHDEALVPLGCRIQKSSLHAMLGYDYYGGRFWLIDRWYDGKYELFVPPDVFRRAQARFTPDKPATPTKRAHGGVFTGWLTCADCGCAIIYEHKRKRSGREYDYWHCTDHHRVHKDLHGKVPCVREEDLFEQFTAALEAVEVPADRADQIARELNKSHHRLSQEREQAIERFKRELTVVDGQLDSAVEKYVAGALERDDYERVKTTLRTQRERVAVKLTEAQKAIDGEYLVLATKILELGKRAKELWKGRAPAEKRELLEKMLSNPRLRARSIEYDYKKPFMVIAEMRRRKVWLPE